MFLVEKEIEAERLVHALAEELDTSALVDARLDEFALAKTKPVYPEVTRKPIGYEHELVEARLALRAEQNRHRWLVPPETQAAVAGIALEWCVGLPDREPRLYVRTGLFAQALDVASARTVVTIDVVRAAHYENWVPAIRVVAQQPGGLFRAAVLELNSSYATLVAGDCSGTPATTHRWQQHMDSVRTALRDVAPHVHRGTARRSLSWNYAGTMTVRTFGRNDPWWQLQSAPEQQRSAEQVGFVDAGPGLVMPAAELPRVRTPDLWDIEIYRDTAVLTHRQHLAWLTERPPGGAIRDAARASISDLIVEAPPWKSQRLS